MPKWSTRQDKKRTDDLGERTRTARLAECCAPDQTREPFEADDFGGEIKTEIWQQDIGIYNICFSWFLPSLLVCEHPLSGQLFVQFVMLKIHLCVVISVFHCRS